MVQPANSPAARDSRAGWFDLHTSELREPETVCPLFNAGMGLSEAATYLDDSGRPVGIWFDRFSDGRGFTLARHGPPRCAHDCCLLYTSPSPRDRQKGAIAGWGL